MITRVEIRRYRDDDLLQVGAVHAASRHAAYAGLVAPDALARVAGFVLGGGTGPVATLNAIHVLPELHGSGDGQALHTHVVAEFRAWSCSTAQLWVLEGNARAQAFYRRNGWTLDGGRDTHDIGGALVPIVRYRLSL